MRMLGRAATEVTGERRWTDQTVRMWVLHDPESCRLQEFTDATRESIHTNHHTRA